MSADPRAMNLLRVSQLWLACHRIVSRRNFWSARGTARDTLKASGMLTATSQIDDARLKDYSLIGRDTALAVERGLAEADW